jgi:hypothetical protein
MVVFDERDGDMAGFGVRGRERKVEKASSEKRAQEVFAGSPQSAPETQFACMMWWQYIL